MSWRYLSYLLIVLGLLTPSLSFADSTISTSGTSGGNTGWGNSGITNIDQSFKATNSTDYIATVDTYQLINAGSGNNYYLTLETDSGGVPSGSVLDTSNTVTNLNSCSSAQTVTFSGAVVLTSGTVYHLKFHTVSIDGSNNNEGCGDTNSYADGTQHRYTGTWDDQSIDEKLTIHLVTPSSGGGGGGGGSGSTTTINASFATTTCTVSGSTTTCVTPLPLLRVQDAGNLIYMLGWILFALWIIVVGFFFNAIMQVLGYKV